MNGSVQIACIIEGHGERQALPVLVRRVAQRFDPTLTVHIPEPIRVTKSRLVRTHGELERAVVLAANKIGGQGAILIVLDSDEDCPATLGPDLLNRARSARSDVPISVIVAKWEYEAWFLAAAESLRGIRGLPADLESPADPETVQGAKEWISKQMPKGKAYSETLDQPALSARLDLDAARRADSFDKLYRDVTRLLGELRHTLA